MLKNGVKIVFVLTILMISLNTGCVKDVTVTITNDKVVATKVSFAKDLAPLFAANCALSGCHVANHTAPDLEKDAAYNAIKKMNIIDAKTPENSPLYLRMAGKLIPAMPPNKASNPSNINNILLAWIKQGALNN